MTPDLGTVSPSSASERLFTVASLSPQALCLLVVSRLTSPTTLATHPREDWVPGMGLALPLWDMVFPGPRTCLGPYLAVGIGICDWFTVKVSSAADQSLRTVARASFGNYLLDTCSSPAYPEGNQTLSLLF